VTDNRDTIQAEYQAGQVAFERGNYRDAVKHLETASSLVDLNSCLGGEVQIWLVTAYEAVGQREEAIALCRRVSKHPDSEARKQGKRLLYILEAPKLASRPEWLIQIPDLGSLQDSSVQDRKGAAVSIAPKREEKPIFQLEPADLSQVNTQDNRFIWIALIAAIAIFAAIWWVR
jgi:tetratricopeptide (TPR) repeat protein